MWTKVSTMALFIKLKASTWSLAEKAFIRVCTHARESTANSWVSTMCQTRCCILQTHCWTQWTKSPLSQNGSIKSAIFRGYLMSWKNVHDITSGGKKGLKCTCSSCKFTCVHYKYSVKNFSPQIHVQEPPLIQRRHVPSPPVDAWNHG